MSSLVVSLGIMQRCFLLTCLVVVSVNAAFEPAAIRWGGLEDKRFVIGTPQHAVANTALEPPIKMTLQAQGGSMSESEVPSFIAKDDNTITWHATGWCLEASGDEVRANKCNGRPNQLWNWLPWGPIQLKGSNKCADVSGQGDLNGAPIQLHECGNKATETWRLEEPLPFPSSTETSLSMRRVMASFIGMAAIAALAVTASIRLWQKRIRPVSQDSEPLGIDQGAICLTAPIVTQQRIQPHGQHTRAGTPVMRKNAPPGTPITTSKVGIAKNAPILANIKEILADNELMFCVRSEGLTSNEMSSLRMTLPEGVTLKCIKNTLLKIALEEYPQFNAEGADTIIKFSNLWFFASGDSIRPAVERWKDFQKTLGRELPRGNDIVGGMFDGQLLDGDGVVAVSQLPTKQEMMGTTAKLLKLIPTKLARSIDEAGPARIARALKEAQGQKLARAVKLVSEQE